LPHSNLPLAYLKYFSFDFIVEEIGEDSSVSTVDIENSNEQKVSLGKGTIFADVVKVGISTLDVRKELARVLKIDEKKIGYAGIKDAKAVTSQKISIQREFSDKILKIPPSNFFLKNLKKGKGAVRMAGLSGNRFTVLLRTQQDNDSEELEKKLKEVAKNGFWNFYWIQRFGTPRLLSHHLGKLLLQGEYEKVIQSFLCDSSSRELPYFQELRNKAKQMSGNWKKIYRLYQPLPYTLRHELKILSHLIEKPADHIGALHSVKDQTTLWVYAYASYLANRILSLCPTSSVPCPEKLPLLLSQSEEDRDIYQTLLQKDDVFSNFIDNLRPFDFIKLLPRSINSKIFPKIIGMKTVPKGVIVSFELPKGSYATTFLAHLFTLTEGSLAPDWMDHTKYDLKTALGTGTIKKTLEKFKDYMDEQKIS